MFRRLLQSGPKYFISAVVVLVSIVGFSAWLFYRHLKNPPANPARHAALENSARLAAANTAAKVAKLETKFGSLILADNDLYDIETGELLFSNWLKYGMPQRLYWQGDTRKVLAQYERGFVRYKLDGNVEAELRMLPSNGIGADYKWTAFSRGGDVYRADIDWQAMKATNERKVTSIGQFQDQFFAQNMILATDKTLILRNKGQLVRVELESGNVKPVRIPLVDIGKRRSPDQKWVVGIERDEFYCFGVDTEAVATIKTGRAGISDYQWLGNDRCLLLVAGKSVILYDRLNNVLSAVADLPEPCGHLVLPSPDGRFVFCTGNKRGVLVDIENRTAAPFPGGAGVIWINNDTVMFSREVQDSDLRGTWLQRIGERQVRVSPEPYLVGSSGPMLLLWSNPDILVFATKTGLSKMQRNGTEVLPLVKSLQPPRQILGVEGWNQ